MDILVFLQKLFIFFYFSVFVILGFAISNHRQYEQQPTATNNYSPAIPKPRTTSKNPEQFPPKLLTIPTRTYNSISVTTYTYPASRPPRSNPPPVLSPPSPSRHAHAPGSRVIRGRSLRARPSQRLKVTAVASQLTAAATGSHFTSTAAAAER